MRRFAVSDIHGCVQTFQDLLLSIQLSEADVLYLLGDFIDRGPDTQGVIDTILDLREAGFKVQCLRGNHEQMFLDALKGGERQKAAFLVNGGTETLRSFGVSSVEEVPLRYVHFMEALPYYIDLSDYLLVHAGFNGNTGDPLLDLDSMLWIRNWYFSIDPYWLGKKKIVHGHTPIGKEAIQGMCGHLSEAQVLNIDAGCVFKRIPDMGHLCAFDLDTHQLFFKPYVG